MNLINFCNRTIEYSFYAIFLLVPLVFAGNTSELFEFNKMWVAFFLTIFIALAWSTKIILERKVTIQRTPLDIPILLFFLSQIISTLFSLDQHVSWWGYYSRFNGGLLSTITYLFLYYAFVSNLSLKHVFRSLAVILFGGLAVILWGLPSHFGYDPTCLVFRGSFDTACWTEAFRPTIRIFSTLGQPAWLAAYVVFLTPLALAYFVEKNESTSKQTKINFFALYYLALAILTYLSLIFTNTRAGVYAFIVAIFCFWLIVFVKKLFPTKKFIRYFLITNALFALTTFFFGSPIEQLRPYTYPSLMAHVNQKPAPAPVTTAPAPTVPTPSPAPSQKPIPSDSGITDSGNIRLYVWKGAIDAWKSNALFGTGVETFAFAYYKFRPAGHNLTTEWDYLYNKAHNEYLNYLTTTGLFGLGTYLFFIGLFIFQTGKWFIVNGKWQMEQKKNEKNYSPYTTRHLLIIGLFSGWLSILITNFFGFSVVIMNIFLFLTPAFVFFLEDILDPEKTWEFAFGTPSHATNPYQWSLITLVCIIGGWWIISLANYWYADTKYALGYNLDRVNGYQDAYPLLLEATKIKPNEPAYADELAINMAVLATGFAGQNDTTNTQAFANQAIELNNQVTTKHPNNVVYWKNRVRLFYTLAQANPSQQLTYYQEALKAIEIANTLAPTDAKIKYNLGVLYGQTGNIQKGIATLQETIKLKPDYRDAYFALGLFYYQASLDQNGKVIYPELKQKAIEVYQYILTNVHPQDTEVQKSLEEWKKGN